MGAGSCRRPPADPHCPQITRIYCYVSVVSLQYLGPIILTFHCTLLLKTLGKEMVGCGNMGGLRRGRMRPRSHPQAISIPRFSDHGLQLA